MSSGKNVRIKLWAERAVQEECYLFPFIPTRSPLHWEQPSVSAGVPWPGWDVELNGPYQMGLLAGDLAAPALGSRSSQNTRNTIQSIFHAQWSGKRAAWKMYFNIFTILFSFLAPDRKTGEFLACNSPRIFHYSPVILLWDFSHYAPISSYFQLQRVCFDDALT